MTATKNTGSCIQSSAVSSKTPKSHNVDPITIIANACIDATGAAPARHLILTKIDKWLRYSNSGQARNKNCAIKVIDKGDCYVFIITDHKTGLTKTGSTRTGKRDLMTPTDRAVAQRQREEYHRQKAEQSARKDRMLSAMAKRVWAGCSKPDTWVTQHPYIVKKDIHALNVRRFQSKKRDVLILPMVDPLSGVKSLYLIWASGFKRPLKGTQMAGLCMAIGHSLDAALVIWLVEGWATGVSLHGLTGDAVVVAFTAGNLVAVMATLVEKYPNAQLRLCADDDRATAKKIGQNPGIEYAKKVQQFYPQVALYKPLFPKGAPGNLSDVNDLVNYKNLHLEVSHD